VRTLGFKDEVRRGWRKLHNGELHTFYTSPNIIRTIKSMFKRWAWHVAHITNAYKIIFGNPEGKRQFGRWEDNIKMHLREQSGRVCI
jgi:hypothetical protein